MRVVDKGPICIANGPTTMVEHPDTTAPIVLAPVDPSSTAGSHTHSYLFGMATHSINYNDLLPHSLGYIKLGISLGVA